MWDTIIIGSGDRGVSSRHVHQIEGQHSISQNSVTYWIAGIYPSVGMTIFKNTKEGQKLTHAIEEKLGLEFINNYLKQVMLSNFSVEQLDVMINTVRQEAYENGYREKAYEIRKALGL